MKCQSTNFDRLKEIDGSTKNILQIIGNIKFEHLMRLVSGLFL
jgi:hypothetical protein